MVNEKEYTNGEITIVWKPDLCIHSAICVNGLPAVFNADKKPWIDPEAANSEQIIKQVGQCPSGALTIKGQDKRDKTKLKMDVKIAAKTPMQVELAEGKNYAWCACGRSQNQPWCDGSHSGTSIKPHVFKADTSKKAYMCMCKHSKNKPYCDGNHNSL